MFTLAIVACLVIPGVPDMQCIEVQQGEFSKVEQCESQGLINLHALEALGVEVKGWVATCEVKV